jgi:hypothetical protein
VLDSSRRWGGFNDNGSLSLSILNPFLFYVVDGSSAPPHPLSAIRVIRSE